MSRAMELVSETIGFFKENIGFSLRELLYYFAWVFSVCILLMPVLFFGSIGKILYGILCVAVIALKWGHFFSQIVRKAAGVDVSGKFTDKVILARSGKVFLIFLILGIALFLVSFLIAIIFGFLGIGDSGSGAAAANAVSGGDYSKIWPALLDGATSNLGLQFISIVLTSFVYALASSKITALSLDHDKDNEVLEKDKVADFAAALLVFYMAYTLLSIFTFVLATIIGFFAVPLFIVLVFAFSIIVPALHGVRYRLARDEDSGSEGMTALPNEGV